MLLLLLLLLLALLRLLFLGFRYILLLVLLALFLLLNTQSANGERAMDGRWALTSLFLFLFLSFLSFILERRPSCAFFLVLCLLLPADCVLCDAVDRGLFLDEALLTVSERSATSLASTIDILVSSSSSLSERITEKEAMLGDSEIEGVPFDVDTSELTEGVDSSGTASCTLLSSSSSRAATDTDTGAATHGSSTGASL